MVARRLIISCLAFVTVGTLFVALYYAETCRHENETQEPGMNISHVVHIIQQQDVVEALLVVEVSTNETLDILEGARTVLESYERGYLEEFVIRIAGGVETGWPHNESMYAANRIVASDWQFGQLLTDPLVARGASVNFTVYRDVWEPQQYWYPPRWVRTIRQSTSLSYNPERKELAIVSFSALGD
jgi:hypothetical protein